MVRKGRSLALDLAGGCRPTAGSKVRLIGVHGPHNEECFLDILGDISEVVRGAHRGAAVIATCDWNADLQRRRGGELSPAAVSLSAARRVWGPVWCTCSQHCLLRGQVAPTSGHAAQPC